MNAETSVPLGSLNLIDLFGRDFTKATGYIDGTLQKIPWLEDGRGRPFYAIGGTWRAVARLHMLESDYPLTIVHDYTMTPKQVDALSESVLTRPQSLKSFGKLSGVRQEMLPHGILVLRRLARLVKPSQIVFSAFGVREGLLYQLLPPVEQARDPLIAACEEMAPTAMSCSIGWRGYSRFPPSPRRRRSAGCGLRHACCPMSAGAAIRTIAATKCSA